MKKLIGFDFFDHLDDIQFSFFDLLIRFLSKIGIIQLILIKNWSKLNDLYEKLIENDVQSKLTFNQNPIFVVRFKSDRF